MVEKPASDSGSRPGPKPKGKGLGRETGFVRTPADIYQMIRELADHELNGWKSQSDVLDDPSCPLRKWLLERYAEMQLERVARAKALQTARPKK